uniref:Uncharacterized protein n=1 Tax=Ditylenchus dipsaci TaxID=166011 RepID=A0A915DTC5_9BILA
MLVDLSEAQEDVIIEILLRVDTKNLIRRCTLVSRQWNYILSQKQFWMRKCQFEGYCLPFRLFNNVSINYKMLCHLKPFNRNFLSDNWDENGRFHPDKRWASRGINNVEIIGCQVTSYDWGTKKITIDLVKEGLQPEILDSLKPPIVISELVAHRYDCGAVYKMKCFLNDENVEVLSLDSNCVFRQEITIDQWQEQKWRKVELVLTSYPVGTRFLYLTCQGKDRQFWAGKYGAKMVNCSVMAKLPS